MNNVIQLPLTFRPSDPETTRQAPTTTKRITQLTKLLEIFCLYDVTDEEAVELLVGHKPTLQDEGLRRRCSDLRALGWITPTGETRANSSGRQRIVCAITNTGRDQWMTIQNG